MNVSARIPLRFVGVAQPPPVAAMRDRGSLSEVGEDKTVAQHAGNAAFATVSVLGAAAARSRALRMLPGLNLAVGVLEGFNGASAHRRGESVAAMGHAGNAVGCFGAFLEDAARLTAAVGTTALPSAVGTAVIGLGIFGGALGVVQGVHEVRMGAALRRETGSKRTLKMGVSDLVSGTLTIAGVGLRYSGMAPALGAGLLICASACDLASIAVDYLDGRRDRPQHNA